MFVNKCKQTVLPQNMVKTIIMISWMVSLCILVSLRFERDYISPGPSAFYQNRGGERFVLVLNVDWPFKADDSIT